MSPTMDWGERLEIDRDAMADSESIHDAADVYFRLCGQRAAQRPALSNGASLLVIARVQILRRDRPGSPPLAEFLVQGVDLGDRASDKLDLEVRRLAVALA